MKNHINYIKQSSLTLLSNVLNFELLSSEQIESYTDLKEQLEKATDEKEILHIIITIVAYGDIAPEYFKYT